MVVRLVGHYGGVVLLDPAADAAKPLLDAGTGSWLSVRSQRCAPAAITALRAAAFAAVRPPFAPPKLKIR